MTQLDPLCPACHRPLAAAPAGSEEGLDVAPTLASDDEDDEDFQADLQVEP